MSGHKTIFSLTMKAMNNRPPYLNSIAQERQKRIEGRLAHDQTAETLWLQSLDKIPVEKDKNALVDAYEYAMRIDYQHEGLSSAIYLAHPLRVASLSLLSQNRPTAELGIVALLHNVLEVSNVSEEALNERFGSVVTKQIQALTVDRARQWDNGYKSRYYQTINNGPHAARIVKIFDKLDNLFILGLNPDEVVRTRYLEEIEKYIVPMARRDTPAIAPYMEELIDDTKETGFYKIN